MEELFKIVFDGDSADTSDDDLVFTFLPLPEGTRLLIKKGYMNKLLELAGQNEQYFFAPNIKNAYNTRTGGPLSDKFTNYYAVFCTAKETGKKLGFLISVEQKNGPGGNGTEEQGKPSGQAMVSAAWPMSFREMAIREPVKALQLIQDLVIHPELFQNVNLFTSLSE